MFWEDVTGWACAGKGQEYMVWAGTYETSRQSVVWTGVKPGVMERRQEDDRQAADWWIVIGEEMSHGVAAASRLWVILTCKADKWTHGNGTSGEVWMNDG